MPECFGCTPTSRPLDAVAWEEGLCGKDDCPVWDMVGGKKK